MSLEVVDVSVSYDGRTVLDHTSLSVPTGQITAVLGPSGCGKSTLLRAVAGLVDLDGGRVLVDGVDVTDVPTHKRRVGMVFQDDVLFPHLDVAANVGYGLRAQRVDQATIAGKVSSLLALVGLDGFEHRRVTTLSGGEAQRIALARALAPEPRVLLMDEPFGALDRDLHDRLVVEVRALLTSLGITAVHVTHDPAEAGALAHSIVRLPST